MVVIAPAFGVALWHGGFTHCGQLSIAAAGTALAMLVAAVPALSARDPGRIAFGVSTTAAAVSGLYDLTWSFPPLVLLGAVAALGALAARPEGP
ncbi:MAG TPA: hypothetical protein VLK79_03625 [Gaiellales bacterium]|nr:hypothetical protein [Gaiellales bacterium]